MYLDLDKSTRKEMLDEADRLKIKGVKDKDKSTVRAALEAHVAKMKHEAAEGQEPPPASAPPPVSGDPLTSDQRLKLAAASDDQIRAGLALPGLPTNWRAEFQAELDRRMTQAQRDAERARRTTKIERYKITKGGRFALPGRMTQLHAGGVISALTHDLDAVRAQGIEIELLRGKVVIGHNEMGRATTLIVDEPQPRELPKGDAPTPPGG